MTVRLTKKRLAALDAALSLDDVLYERFRRMQQSLREDEERLAKKQRLVKVIGKRSRNGIREILPILSVHITNEGTILEVGLS